jgi:hypothetical protein
MNKTDQKEIAEALFESMTSREGESLSDALMSISHNLKYLGTGDTATREGAIELLAGEIKEGCSAIASAILELSNAIREHE